MFYANQNSGGKEPAWTTVTVYLSITSVLLELFWPKPGRAVEHAVLVCGWTVPFVQADFFSTIPH